MEYSEQTPRGLLWNILQVSGARMNSYKSAVLDIQAYFKNH